MKANPVLVSRLLKTARGQIDGVLKMIDDDRYCIDISIQLQAILALIRKANNEVLKAHVRSCVKDVFSENDTLEQDKKIDELIVLIEKAQSSVK